MNILEHPILFDIYNLCREIETLPPSELETKLVVMAAQLTDPARVLIKDKDRLDWLLANSHIKVGEIYLTSRESLDEAMLSNYETSSPTLRDDEPR